VKTNINSLLFIVTITLLLFFGCKKDSVVNPTTTTPTPVDYSHFEGTFYTQRIINHYINGGHGGLTTSSIHQGFDQFASLSVQNNSIQISNSIYIGLSIPIDSASQTVFQLNDWVLEYHNDYDSIRLYNAISSPYADTVHGIRDETRQYINSNRASFNTSNPQVISYNLSIYKKISSPLTGVFLDTLYVATLPVEITKGNNEFQFSVDGKNIIIPIHNTYLNEERYEANSSILKEKYAYWDTDTLSIEWIEEYYSIPDYTHYYYRGVKN
jgi:hypothetical protein